MLQFWDQQDGGLQEALDEGWWLRCWQCLLGGWAAGDLHSLQPGGGASDQCLDLLGVLCWHVLAVLACIDVPQSEQTGMKASTCQQASIHLPARALCMRSSHLNSLQRAAAELDHAAEDS